MLAAYRNRPARRHRAEVLAHNDRFLAATERAALALQLEGVPVSRIEVCPPGIDVDRFTGAATQTQRRPAPSTCCSRPADWRGRRATRTCCAPSRCCTVESSGRPRGPLRPRVEIIGCGPEEARLRAYAEELGLGAAVEIGSVPYDEMPARFAAASAMVLATQASASMGLHPADPPRAFWEEQFGMVLAEAMAARLAIVTTTSGAVPEVLAGAPATFVAPGDWVGLARALADGPLRRAPGERVDYPPEILERYSTAAAARRLAAAYERTLA